MGSVVESRQSFERFEGGILCQVSRSAFKVLKVLMLVT